MYQTKTMSQNEFSSINIISVLLNGKKWIIGITALGAIASIITSLLLTEKFESTAVIFPAKNNSVSFIQNSTSKDNILLFGEEEEAEQMLQVLESGEIRDRIIHKYELWRHYDIKIDDKERKYKLKKAYAKHVSSKRNRNGAIEVQVLDLNPDTAALIANDIVALYDSVKNRMLKEKAYEAYKVMEYEYSQVKTYLEDMEAELGVLKSKGALNDESYAAIADAYAKSVASGRENKNLKAIMDSSDKYSAKAEALKERIEVENLRLSNMKEQFDQNRSNLNATLSHKFVSELAEVSDKKAYPIRWLIVVVSTMISFIFAVFLLVGLENYKVIKNRMN